LPEKGDRFEGGADYSPAIEKWYFSLGASLYSRKIENWVVWVPISGAVSSPQNLQKVWSRGTETDWKLRFTNKEFGWQIGLGSSYVLSTVFATEQSYSDVLGKQLIYTPRYQFNASFKIWYEGTSILFIHNYSGYRFTSSDNREWLDPYQLASLRLNYNYPLQKTNLVVYLACNNLFNSNYQIVKGRPMPLRNYEIGMSFLIQQKSTTKTNNSKS